VQGFATQIFTEVGNYYLPFDKEPMDLRKRMAAVACAISIDYDYYSRRAGAGGWLFPGAAIFGGYYSDE
jgi:Scramblase